jgi:hypothetical protein
MGCLKGVGVASGVAIIEKIQIGRSFKRFIVTFVVIFALTFAVTIPYNISAVLDVILNTSP